MFGNSALNRDCHRNSVFLFENRPQFAPAGAFTAEKPGLFSVHGVIVMQCYRSINAVDNFPAIFGQSVSDLIMVDVSNR